MLQDWFQELPVITRTYLSLAMVTTVSCGIELISPFQLYLNFHLIFTRFEFWRLVTNFCYFGKFGLDFLFHMFFLVRYCRMLEEGPGFRGRPADFLWMIFLGSVLMLLICPFMKVHFLGSALTFMMVYVWSRRNYNVHMSFLGLFSFTAAYLPLVLLGFSWLLHGSMNLDLLGIFVGHTYYFFEDVYPSLGGKRWINTPYLLHFIFGTHRTTEQPQPPVAAEPHPHAD
eukprot:c1860_g1_i2.p1 GENE.c1860_g1_i2~~c1860_g1_i2.p1  ORF type:complete len:228 (+),score=29.91 c1860_g1_i2:33-716(+)